MVGYNLYVTNVSITDFINSYLLKLGEKILDSKWK